MPFKPPNLKNLGIATKFIFWFLVISIVPLVIATYVSYKNSRKILEEEVKNSLLAVTDNKANQIETFLQRKKKDASVLASISEVNDAVQKFTGAHSSFGKDSSEYSALEQEISPMLTYYQRLFGYDDIILISSDGEVLFSVKGLKQSKSLYEIVNSEKSELAETFIRVEKSQEADVSNFEYNSSSEDLAIFIAVPIFKDSGLAGVIAFQMSNKGIYEFAQDYTGLRDTGETILVTRLNEEAVFITPLRFDPEAVFKRRIKFGLTEGAPIQKSLAGEKGLGIFNDYRKQQVLAVWRYLPTFRLGMVVKMDTQEIFASAGRLRNRLLKISVLLLVVVVIVAFFVAHSISGPIKNLTFTSKIISEGELSARAMVNTGDEIQELAASFNQMTDKLVEAKANVEQKKAEVEEQKRLLEEANKELDSFVYTVSHDLRAPLRGVDGLAKFLADDYADELDSQGRDFIKKIRSGTDRMNKLIDDLLKLSRISRIKNPYENVNVNDLVNSVINRIEFDIKENKVDLRVAGNLPVVCCDRIKIEEVFLNLINNGIKYSSKNKDAAPKVEVGYNDRPDTHEFYIRDNGIGIDKKYHQEIFGIFKRLHTQDEYEGTGAGLSIVKKIIDDHKGSIWVDSELGRGSTFYFTIPKELQERKKIGQILLEEGRISEDDLNRALRKQGLEQI